MLNLSWDNFDKAFWVSSTNMRNLINVSLNLNINIGSVEQDVNSAWNAITTIQNNASNTDQILYDFMDLVQQHMANQTAINNNFMAILRDMSDILIDHEQRIQNLGG